MGCSSWIVLLRGVLLKHKYILTTWHTLILLPLSYRQKNIRKLTSKMVQKCCLVYGEDKKSKSSILMIELENLDAKITASVYRTLWPNTLKLSLRNIESYIHYPDYFPLTITHFHFNYSDKSTKFQRYVSSTFLLCDYGKIATFCDYTAWQLKIIFALKNFPIE